MKHIHLVIDNLLKNITDILDKIVEYNDENETELVRLLTKFKKDLSAILYKSKADERKEEEGEINNKEEELEFEKYEEDDDDFYGIKEEVVECQLEDKTNVFGITAGEENFVNIVKKQRFILPKLEEKADDLKRKYRKYKCPSEGCGERFHTEIDLAEHALGCDGNTEVNCPFCEEKFKAGSQLIVSHVETMHVLERNNPVFVEFIAKHKKTWICQECGKVFVNETVFKNHVRENHPNIAVEGSKRKCKRYKDDGPSMCNECGKTFSKRSLLSDHIFRNHQKRTYDCPECSKQFPTRPYLNRHIRNSHLEQRNYACDKCEKQFREKKRLMVHITAVHDKLKPFLCEYCPYECAAVSNLNLHRKKVHKATENTTKKKLINDVKNGQHPYYNEEKFQLLLVAQG